MPEENEVYLAVPYLNEDGLELYTRLILRKLAGLVISSTTNIHDYEQEYNANPEVKVVTIQNDIEPGTIYRLPLSYGVGSHQLRVTVSGYMMYPEVDYEEVGEEGEISNQVKFLTTIQARSILGVIVYPRQFSFGRNINVSSLVAPELAISDNPTSLISLDENGKAIVEASTVKNLIQENDVSYVHIEGNETVIGQKTFKTPLIVDLSETNIQGSQLQSIMKLDIQTNGMQYNLTPINIIAGSRSSDEYSGVLAIGSNAGSTWIGSGKSLLELPNSFARDELDFAENKSVVLSSDADISFYVGYSTENSNYFKVAEFLSDGTTQFNGPAFAPTPSLEDNSTRIATTEYVKNVAMSLDGDQEIGGQKSFINSPTAPTPNTGDSSEALATTEFVSNTLNVFQTNMIETIQSIQQEVDISSISEEQINTLF